MLKNAKGSPFSAPGARAGGHLARQFGRFGFFMSVILFLWIWHFEFFDTFTSICYFWAFDMAPTYAFSGLFLSNNGFRYILQTFT